MAIVHLIGVSGYEVTAAVRSALAGVPAADVVVADPALAAPARRCLPETDVRVPRPEEVLSTVSEAIASGRTVARLMAGDPFGSERGLLEARELGAAGVPYRVVPAPGAIALALTSAGVGWEPAAGLTALEVPEPGAVDWSRLPVGIPLALSLDARDAPAAVRGLISAGWDDTVPALLVLRPASPRQTTLEGSLAEVGRGSSRAEGDALLAVGGYVRRRRELEWFESRPLFGVRVVVTRPRPQAEAFAARLAGLGADTLVFPAIRIVPPTDPAPLRRAIESLDGYDWLVFTSANGVRWFWRALLESGRDARSLAGLRIACIGPATAATLAERGVRADLVPEEFVAEAVLDAMTTASLEGRRVLVPRAQEAREVLPRGLEAAGATVDVVAAYRSVPDTEGGAEVRAWLEDAETAMLTFTSSSTVRNFVAAVGADVPAAAAAIGPITASTARDAGLNVVIEAEEYTIDGLTAALSDHFGRVPEGRRSRSSG